MLVSLTSSLYLNNCKRQNFFSSNLPNNRDQGQPNGWPWSVLRLRRSGSLESAPSSSPVSHVPPLPRPQSLAPQALLGKREISGKFHKLFTNFFRLSCIL